MGNLEVHRDIADEDFLTPGRDACSMSRSQWADWFSSTFTHYGLPSSSRDKYGQVMSHLCRGVSWMSRLAQESGWDYLDDGVAVVGIPHPDRRPELRKKAFVHYYGACDDRIDNRIFVGFDRIVSAARNDFDAVIEFEDKLSTAADHRNEIVFKGTILQRVELTGVEERAHLATGPSWSEPSTSDEKDHSYDGYHSDDVEFEGLRMRVLYASRPGSGFTPEQVNILKEMLLSAYRYRIRNKTYGIGDLNRYFDEDLNREFLPRKPR